MDRSLDRRRGDAAMTALRARVVAGNPPTQLKGLIQEWANEGAVANIDEVAKAENWDAVLPVLATSPSG